MKCLCFQCSGGKGKEEKKGGSSLQEVKRRGKMERSREEEEEMSDRLKTLVRLRVHDCFMFSNIRNDTEW